MVTRIWRRRKLYMLYPIAFLVCIYVISRRGLYNTRYIPLRPLYSSSAEVQRLLKFMTSYHYMCNSTVALGNRSHFPICIDNDTGIDLDAKGNTYSIWSPEEILFEKFLATNYSFEVYIITDSIVPKHYRNLNHTHWLQTILVPNDIHDFSRNSFGQRTFNDIMEQQRHSVDILKIEMNFDHAHTWEILYYMIEDHQLHDIKQLHIAIIVDKLDEDFLYNWYRCLYNLYYKEGMRLYHTAASSPLCLQVTMMESCVYWLSWIRDPGDRVFVMHPPADFGTQTLEEERLLAYITSPVVTCHNLQSAIHPSMSTIVMPIDKSVGICKDYLSSYDDTHDACKALILSNHTDVTLKYTLKKSKCSTVQFRPELPYIKLSPEDHLLPSIKSMYMMGVVDYVWKHQNVDLILISYPGQEWGILAALLDTHALINTTQLVVKIHLNDRTYGKHPVILRRMYSELRRLETQGFHLFDSVPCARHNDVQTKETADCYKLGFMRHSKRARLSNALQYIVASPIGGF